MTNTVQNVDDAIEAFAQATEVPPEEALRWALEHWEEAVPRFLALLEAYTEVAKRLGILMENERPAGSGPVLVKS